MALYKLVSRHSAPGVAKKAKQMLFGFSAGAYLKAHTISCALLLSWRSHHACTSYRLLATPHAHHYRPTFPVSRSLGLPADVVGF